MNELIALALLGASAFGYPPAGRRYPQYTKPWKTCAQCGAQHQHNNRYCSADCCRAHRKGIPQ